MKVGVFGLGVVGSAVYRFFKERHNDSVYGHDIDVAKNINTVVDTMTADVLFLCLPSETKVVGNKYYQDLNALKSVLSFLAKMHYSGVVCIKTTTLPKTCAAFAEEFTNLKITHNPEFLTAAKPYDDFCNQAEVIIGGEHANVVAELYREHFSIVLTTPTTTTTELAKYMHNTFLATKVMFCNEFYHLCESCGEDYGGVNFLAEGQGGIGKGHTKVPGPDGSLGYGGMCLPKDTLAMLQFMNDNNLCPHILSAVCESNSVRNDEYLRGKR